jgi:hypothetical protein
VDLSSQFCCSVLLGRFGGGGIIIIIIIIIITGPGSSVSIATSYGLDGLGIESQWG